jgi:hypothetical protein
VCVCVCERERERERERFLVCIDNPILDILTLFIVDCYSIEQPLLYTAT